DVGYSSPCCITFSLQGQIFSYVVYISSVTNNTNDTLHFYCIVCVCVLNYHQQGIVSNFIQRYSKMMAVNPGEDESVALSHVTIEDLLSEIRQYLTPQDVETIQRAYYVANQAHLGT